MKTGLATLILSLMLTTAVTAEWWEEIEIKGDLRYRHEMIDIEGAGTRNRQRMRARLTVIGQANPDTRIGIQLATGSSDPVSTNQTLDGSFSSKNLVLDMAYLDYTPSTMPGLSVKGGKFKNPFFKPGKSELLWDSDLNPEGIVATVKVQPGQLSWTGIAAGLWVEERSSSEDSWMAAAQGVARLHLDEDRGSIAAGAGFFNYVNTAGQAFFFDATEPMGNTADMHADYAHEYELLEVFGEITHQMHGRPITLLADYVSNTAADSLNTGWKVGVRLGKAKRPGSWECRYNYRQVEADAVVGTFTDSDFRGGGTDAKGHEIGAALQLARNAAFKISYFINQIGLDREERDFRRLQVDLQLKF